MRYMVQVSYRGWVCFDDEETKTNYENLGYWVMDMENLWV